MKNYGTATSSATPVPTSLSQNDPTSAIPASRKSSESANPINIKEPSMTPASASLAELNRKSRPKVWSLIMTLFMNLRQMVHTN